jgi:uncharacterized phiE125 gp8 family phage protein
LYAVTVLTPPEDAPVSAAELRARLRLNDQGEDAELEEMLAAAVELFEHDAQRPVLQTVYRQDLSAWPASGVIVLGRGGVTAVSTVKRYLADGTASALAADQWRADLLTPPARVRLAAIPESVQTAAGIPVSPVGYVEFTAGWPAPEDVPAHLRTALKLMAGHFYENREAWRDSAFEMRETPDGWKRVVAKYKLAVSGDWGQ